MLSARLIILVLLGYYTQAAVSSHFRKGPTNIWMKLEEVFQNKCLKNANENKYEQVLRQLREFKTVYQNYTMNDIISNDLCQSQGRYAKRSLDRLLEALQPCLEREEEYLKEFVTDAYSKHLKFFCDHIGFIVSELPGPTLKCITTLTTTSWEGPHSFCYSQSKIFGYSLPTDAITKQNLCEDLLKIQYCYDNIYKERCAEASEFRRFQTDLMTKTFESCRDVWNGELQKYLNMDFE